MSAPKSINFVNMRYLTLSKIKTQLESLDMKTMIAVAALKDAQPGSSVRLARRDIVELGNGNFVEVLCKLAPVLNFSHSWVIEPVTDNIIIVRL